MPITYEGKAGRVERKGTEAYICDKFLDLVENEPFYQIKVKQLVEYAGISRSTFYTYFDSIYDVVQKLEDDFLEGFYPEDIAFSVLIKNDLSKALEQIEYVKRHARTLRLLCGPNGDSGFIGRIERAIKKLAEHAFEEIDSSLAPHQREILAAYIAGGTLNATWTIARQGENYSVLDFKKASKNIIKANDALLDAYHD